MAGRATQHIALTVGVLGIAALTGCQQRTLPVVSYVSQGQLDGVDARITVRGVT